jgi:hypothetical protein
LGGRGQGEGVNSQEKKFINKGKFLKERLFFFVKKLLNFESSTSPWIPVCELGVGSNYET